MIHRNCLIQTTELVMSDPVDIPLFLSLNIRFGGFI